MNYKIMIALLIAGLCAHIGYTQGNAPGALNIGDKVPDYAFKNAVNFKTDRPRISDFRGKLLIMDFWSTYCGSCIAAFPKMEALQRKFGDKIQIIVANATETPAQVDERMAQSRKYNPKLLLPSLPSVTGDTIWKKLFPYASVPHHVWIDGNGIVIAITGGRNTNAENIDNQLNGKPVNLALKKDLKAFGYDAVKQGIIKPGYASMVVGYYSGVIRNCPGLGFNFIQRVDSLTETITSSYGNRSVMNLYETAFDVSHNRLPVVLEVDHREDYFYPKESSKLDGWAVNNMFSYEACLPFRDKQNLNLYMQQDINRFFGQEKGIEGKVVKRLIPCLLLVKVKDSLLEISSQSDGLADYKIVNERQKWTNQPIDYIFSYIGPAIQEHFGSIVCVNETGVSRDVKLNMELPVLTEKNLPELKKNLHKYGLDLIEAKREMDVLVIKYK